MIGNRAGIKISTLERRPEIGFDSYDRLFPSQDTLPKGGLAYHVLGLIDQIACGLCRLADSPEDRSGSTGGCAIARRFVVRIDGLS